MSGEIEHHEHAKRLNLKIVDADKLEARLLCGLTVASKKPEGWKDWTKPRDSLAIDDAVATLISKRNRPRILPKQELAEAGIECPFWTMRQEVALAAKVAAAVQFEHQTARTINAESRHEDAKTLKEAQTLAGRLYELLRDPAFQRAFAAHPGHVIDDRLHRGELADAFDQVEIARESLSHLSDAIGLIRQGSTARELDAVQRAFASRIAHTFERLTGERAGKGGGPFASFLHGAGATAGFPEKTDWENISRKIL